MCSFIYSRRLLIIVKIVETSVLVACWSTVCPRVVGGTVAVHVSLFQRVPRAHSSLLLADGALECCPRQCRFIVVDVASLSRSSLDNVTRWEFTSSTAVLWLSGVAGLDRFGNVSHCCEVLFGGVVLSCLFWFVVGLFVVCDIQHRNSFTLYAKTESGFFLEPASKKWNVASRTICGTALGWHVTLLSQLQWNSHFQRPSMCTWNFRKVNKVRPEENQVEWSSNNNYRLWTMTLSQNVVLSRKTRCRDGNGTPVNINSEGFFRFLLSFKNLAFLPPTTTHNKPRNKTTKHKD